MDPEASLKSAQAALADDNAADAAEYLQAYAQWRRRGGFEPNRGDERARDMREHLLRLLALSDGIDDTFATERQVCNLLDVINELRLTYACEQGGDRLERKFEKIGQVMMITSVNRECRVPLTTDEYVIVGFYDDEGSVIDTHEGMTLADVRGFLRAHGLI